ncbi:hypothetical protein [Piscinibacter gummiphilus]|uniref:Uncharacterized protein n=1 Tax=Piscinibacter gummiphilus TaxID=946333 RepID=A0A1W6LFA3_9BURK|nr:hypothetical protein [Piscinibacter gummiphilus]ARN22919.1 hypothetical protein A4W93_25070 [Piscinibacter gummiphilus]ATU67618.1 hypothetical protein CPZ87_25205 [Piscinibacter gummiphilus]GLS96745.1 hypothetical protein GCM10007918_40370 [Piscinibacter gummiphilus]
MSRSFRSVTAVFLLAVSTLAACGGGGGDEVAAAEAAPSPPPTNDRTACFPDRATYDGLVLHLTQEEALKRIGCPGFEPAPTLATAEDKIYRWADLQQGRRSMELVFRAPFGLFMRSGYFSVAEDKPSSSCEPTRAAYDQLQPFETDLAAAVRAFGCEGELRADILTFNGHEQRYAWGHYGDKTRPRVLLTFLKGKLSEKSSDRLP